MSVKKRIETRSALDYAVAYVDRRARTEYEVQKKLADAGYSEEDTAYAIERLKEALMLDDTRYAESYVSSRLAVRGHSRKSLRDELIRHHVDSVIADNAVAEVDDDIELENAYEGATKAMRSYYGKTDDSTCRIKTIRRLVQHGYGYETAKRATERAWEELIEARAD